MNDTTEPLSPPPDQHKPGNFLVVGIGGSAGAIAAMQGFFEQVAGDSGMAYVVILHLSPEHDSKLAEVLQASCSIPVRQVTERVRVEPDHVYLVPPDRHLTIADERICVTPNVTTQDRRAPVDIFFRALAESHRARAVCVVLSGTGANGSMGLKRIKERGGAAFVQDPAEAAFDEMPGNSIATGLVDQVLPAAEIPGEDRCLQVEPREDRDSRSAGAAAAVAAAGAAGDLHAASPADRARLFELQTPDSAAADRAADQCEQPR